MSPSNIRSTPMNQPARALRLMLASLVVISAAGLTQNALAQPMGPHGGRHGGMEGPGMMMGGRMLDQVNATADQRAQIKTIMDAARADLKANHDSARTLHQQLQTAFAATTVDARAVESLRSQISALHDVQSKRMTQAMLDASKVLTPEQRKSLADMMAKRQAMMQRHAAERAAMDKSASK